MREVSKINLGNYLHLTWGGFDNYTILKEAKTYINMTFKEKLSKQIGIPKNFSEIESLYNARTKAMSERVDKVFQERGYNEILGTIDEVAQKLPSKTIQGVRNFKIYRDRIDQALTVLRKLIEFSGPGLTGNNIDELEKWKAILETAMDRKSLIGGVDEKDFLPKLRNFLVTRASGLALEIFSQAALIDANIQGLNKVLHVGNKTGDVLVKMDEKIEADYNRQRQIEEQINQEPGVDILLKYKIGQGGSLIYSCESFEGIQVKNYEDISLIPLGGRLNTTLGKLNIDAFFGSKNNLINAAAALGQNPVAKDTEGLPLYFFTLVNNKQDNPIPEWTLRQQWLDVMDQVRQLASLDAIAYNNYKYLNQAMYYLIRDKTNGRIKIISKYDILKNAQNSLNLTTKKSDGKRAFSKYNSEVARKNYTNIHIKYFQDNPKYDNEEDSENRSDKVYESILEKIMNTKITVALNATDF